MAASPPPATIVSMVRCNGRYAAVRYGDGEPAVRLGNDETWSMVDPRGVTRARRPWWLRIALRDGQRLTVRPCLPREATVDDCGSPATSFTASSRGVKTVPTVILGAMFAVLASPFLLRASIRRTKLAAELEHQLTNS